MRIDKAALDKGRLVVEFIWPLEGREVELRAIYPDTYPRLRPTVQLRGDPATFPKRHCSPDEGSLCLLGRDSRQWRQQWTLADLLGHQLADALSDAGEEDPQGEPAEFWWNGHGLADSYCLVDSSWDIGSATQGKLRIRFNCQERLDAPPRFRALVAEVGDDTGQTLAQWSEPVPEGVLQSAREAIVPWMYVDEVLLPSDVKGQLGAFVDRLAPSAAVSKVSADFSVQWFAVLYKTELQEGQLGLGWLLVVAYGRRQAFQQNKAKTVAIVRTYRAGAGDIAARASSFHRLRGKKAAVFGLGAIGAPLALELARNGCALLRLVDHDVVEPGNSIRWPLGASAWGASKAGSLEAFIREQYPWTRVDPPVTHNIGVQAGDDAMLSSVLNGVDIAIDATASYGVSTVLSDYCSDRGIPLITLYASPPVTGGVVARFAPQSGCPTCLEFAHHDGSILRAPGFGDETGLTQPPGCAERTFTGASFDLQELSLEAMRLIVETLASPTSTHSEVRTLSLATEGQRISPAWRTDPLPRRETCSCGRRS